MGKEGVAERLKNMDAVRKELEALEKALGELNPEERLVAEFLLISPQKGNAQRLCEILGVEHSSVYRKREKVLEKIAKGIMN